MSVSEDKIEQERIARQAAIKAALDSDSKADPAEATAQPVQPKLYPPLRAWEKVINGRREQYRPMTSREIEAETERHFLRGQFKADQAHGEKVRDAIKEAEREEKDNAKRRKHEETTGKRPYGERRFIPLSEARRRGYLQSENASNGKPDWWSPGNESGLFAGGR